MVDTRNLMTCLVPKNEKKKEWKQRKGKEIKEEKIISYQSKNEIKINSLLPLFSFSFSLSFSLFSSPLIFSN